MELFFGAGSETVIVKVIGHKIYFSYSKIGLNDVPVEDFMIVKKNWKAIVKEYPDLKHQDKQTIVNEGKKRFRMKIAKMTEKELKDYIIYEMENNGLVFLGFGGENAIPRSI